MTKNENWKGHLAKLPLDGSHVGNSGLVRYFTVQKETDEIKQQTSGDHNNRCPCWWVLACVSLKEYKDEINEIL